VTAEHLRAQRDAALVSLDAMVKLVEEIGGYLSHRHQEWLKDALFVLETTGYRVPSRDWRVEP